jgi:glutathione S-transferase
MWALDHHQLGYETIEHTPFLGERRLRKLVGEQKKRATVPVLLAGDAVISESWDIAAYADREGTGTKLIAPEHEEEIRRLSDLADETMVTGRALVTQGILRVPAALDTYAPSFVPRWARPLLRPATRYGTKWFARKYNLAFDQRPAQLAKLRSSLETLRAALARGPYLVGSFSYADIVMASMLQGVMPPPDRYVPLEPAARQAWTIEEVPKEFPDLFQWRDDLYGRHRR